ncbi:YhbY family RNA-binding protein [Lentisphaera profundi]|uniref:YhbY family RNA-binding protein n=1 Tax=Lentisphaera profundi TaxID=1658616 RepID=A0ABY7VZX4_9BACT|nr:YhbY family RNA-binding protein [Lentisphaera profundi]WDE98336.1 YhbY family RNA-binding protein [Lentisphaera profundi]
MKKLSGSEARACRAQGAKLQASAVIGKRGLTDENIKIIEQAFLKQSLVKVTIRKKAFEEPKKAIAEIAEKFDATIVQQLGSALLLYKDSESVEDAESSED